MTLSGTVLITGATRGIGRYLALDLAKSGFHVIATGRDRAALSTLAAEANVDTVLLDVADRDSIALAVEAVMARTSGRGVDVLINNAGYGQAGPLLELDDDLLREQFEVNVFGLMAVTRAFVPQMLERKSGVVINVSSTGGRITFPFFGAYHASKYALEAMSDALRMELAPFGVRVVVIEPGPVESGFADRSLASLPPASPRYRAAYARADALRAVADRFAVGPELVARAVRRAIRSRLPRARYVVPPLRFEILFLLQAFLPTCLIDAFFRRAAGLSKIRTLADRTGAVAR
jgi:short-subunit dehydrogenase